MTEFERDRLAKRTDVIVTEVKLLQGDRLVEVFNGIMLGDEIPGREQRTNGLWGFPRVRREYEESLVSESSAEEPDFETVFSDASEVLEMRHSIKALSSCRDVVPIQIPILDSHKFMLYGVALPVDPSVSYDELIILEDAVFSVKPRSLDAETLKAYTYCFDRDTGPIQFAKLGRKTLADPNLRREAIRTGMQWMGAEIKQPGDTRQSLADLSKDYALALVTLSREQPRQRP